MDDEHGWDHLLLELWSDEVCDAVVARIERTSVGRWGWLARVFGQPDEVRSSLTETVHAVVLAAIQDETGADLDALGSQAAWDCYEQVWSRLSERWADGGRLAIVPLGAEPDIVRALSRLPAEGAVAAGADVDGYGVQPLWLRGRLRIDEQGLRAYLQLDGGRAPTGIRRVADDILGRLA